MKALLLAFGLAIALALTACGGTKLSAVATTPQAKKAEKKVQSCLSSSNMLTKSGRQGFMSCVAPKGAKKQVESCVQKDLATGKYFTKGERTAVEVKAINCVAAAS